MQKQERIQEIISRLKVEFPTVDTPLIHDSAYQLLVAVILSAQTLDTTTNKVTPALFKKYPTVYDLAKADPEELWQIIRIINFGRTKSRRLIQTANLLITNFKGQIPNSMEELITLPGVGRKVANVVISEWFVRHALKKPGRIRPTADKREDVNPVGVVVDTHVKRVAYRLGLTKQKTPEKIEQDLMKNLPKEEWVDSSLRFIFHGRKTCKSQRPLCEGCPLRDICPKNGVDPEIVKKVERLKS